MLMAVEGVVLDHHQTCGLQEYLENLSLSDFHSQRGGAHGGKYVGEVKIAQG